LPPWNPQNQQQDPAMVNGGGQGQGLEHIITNVIIQNAPVLAQAIFTVLSPQNKQQDPAMVNGGGVSF